MTKSWPKRTEKGPKRAKKDIKGPRIDQKCIPIIGAIHWSVDCSIPSISNIGCHDTLIRFHLASGQWIYSSGTGHFFVATSHRTLVGAPVTSAVLSVPVSVVHACCHNGTPVGIITTRTSHLGGFIAIDYTIIWTVHGRTDSGIPSITSQNLNITKIENNL